MYYSSVNCLFELFSDKNTNGSIISEAYSIRVNLSRGVMPYYSWADRNVKRFVKGTILVEGALILNVNSIGYLKSLIDGTASPQVASQTLIDTLQEELNSVSTLLDSRIVVPEDTSSIPVPTPSFIDLTVSQQDMIEIATARLNLISAQQQENISPESLNDDDFLDEECSIKIYEGNSSSKKLRESITGLVFTGKSYEITAGSSMNIKYAFPFVAKKATI